MLRAGVGSWGRGRARQVDGAKVAIQHNLGLGGAAVPTVYTQGTSTRCSRTELRSSPGRARHRPPARAAHGVARRQDRRQTTSGGPPTAPAPTGAYAQAVVDWIVAAGGEAVANTDSVSDFDAARRIVDTAIDAFGDFHVVVNNAGILRDKMLVSMTEQDFDDVIAVHLKGTFNVTWARRRRVAERSKAGDVGHPQHRQHVVGSRPLHGNVGQTNYAALRRQHRRHDDRQRCRAGPLQRQGQRHRPPSPAPG